MSLFRSPKGILVFYWFIAYFYLFPFYILLKFGYINISRIGYFTIFAMRLLYLVVLLFASLYILRRKGERNFKKYFGLSDIDIRDLFAYSGLPIAPFALSYLIILLNLKNFEIGEYLTLALPLFIVENFDRFLVPIVGFVHWGLSGIIGFIFLQAFPYELGEEDLGFKKSFLITFLLWSGLYNGLFYSIVFDLPLSVTLLGEIIDVIVLGFIFLLVYTRIRNCIGLIAAYIFVFEAPVKACIYYGWGLEALFILVILGALWAVISIVLFIQKRL